MPFDKCPMCGYKEAPTYVRQPSQMNHYVNKDNPKEIGILNDDRPECSFTTKVNDKEVTKNWVRKDVWDKQQAEKKQVPATPPTR